MNFLHCNSPTGMTDIMTLATWKYHKISDIRRTKSQNLRPIWTHQLVSVNISPSSVQIMEPLGTNFSDICIDCSILLFNSKILHFYTRKWVGTVACQTTAILSRLQRVDPGRDELRKGNRASIHQAVKPLIAKSHGILKPRDWML